MNKSILIITQYYSIGGLETYINTQVKDLVAHGYQVHLMYAVVADPSLLPDGLSSCHENIHLSNGSIEQLVQGVDLIRQVIKEKGIDVIHVHPFDCIFPAVIAADCEKIPSLLTLHGPLSLQHFTRNIYNQALAIYFLKTLHTIFCVSQETADQLAEIIDHPSVMIVPNLIDTAQTHPAITDETVEKRWLIASRLDEDKSAGIMKFIDFASRCQMIHGIDIYGTGSDEDTIKTYVSDNNFNEWVGFKGVVSDIPSVMPQYAGFAGMGRGVLEAGISQLPVCLVGYDGIKGILDDETFKHAAYCNFSGRNLANAEEDVLQEQFAAARPLPPDLLIEYQSDGRWSQILENMVLPDKERYDNGDSLQLYQQLCKAPSSQENESFLIANAFTVAIFKTLANQLIANSIKINAHDDSVKETVKMEDKASQAPLDTPVNANAASSGNDVIAKLAALEEQNLSLQNDVKSLVQLLTSVAAKQEDYFRTLPHAVAPSAGQKLRYLVQVAVQSLTRADKRYELAKTLYWRLPESVRLKLQTQRHRYVQKHFEHACNSAMTDTSTPEDIPDWVAAVNQSEKVVFIPCSFEFDELVNQRPINAAKYFSEKGYQVIFIAWQWTPQETLSKGCSQVWNNVYQFPLYDFVKYTRQCHLHDKTAFFVITMPAKVFLTPLYEFRAQGCNIIYDIMDEWECFHKVGQAPWYQKEIEETLILQSDYVCGVAPSLRDKFAYLRSDIEVVGNGYSEKVLGDTRNIAKDNGNKVGYFGHLTDSWFDWDIVFKLAEQFPQYHFEIIGYGEPEWVVNKAKNIANITLVGKVMPKDLHQYVKEWSIGLIPFKSGELAQAVDPIKIYEYLYFGLPTLVTGIEHIKRYPMTYFSDGSDVVDLFEKTINSERHSDELETFLQETTWAARFEEMELNTLKRKGIRELYAS
ncbi:Glycosyltransferase Gtf1 [Serratia marcescens]|uniref:glycosyltransferase family 4 protein n=1 Tax=Serratia marcescens TaxID=615 RepID=UPI001D2A279D|nr:glycosyltransferase [Serratia marcescens]CAF2678522.1 Glycosyltransferase Gtf1 [Serratia marcescens]CAH5170165.1 Glycosyltransferase Gtf1 [Serratia marcescens]